MKDTWLGWPPDRKGRERIAAVREPAEMVGTDWGWNSAYWLGFGAPWGGMLTSPSDFARFCRLMLNGGPLGQLRRPARWPHLRPLGRDRYRLLARSRDGGVLHSVHDPAAGARGPLPC